MGRKRLERPLEPCSVCGRLCDHSASHGITHNMCRKHYEQVRRFGKTLDTNPRTIWDPNEVRVVGDYAEVDTYTGTGEVLNTFKLDIEDINLLKGHKWRTVFKGKQNSPYLLTGHGGTQGTGQIYFHRLVMGNPTEEVDHINRDSTDNRKSNLRISYRNQQIVNTGLRIDNVQGIKGVYFIQRDCKYRTEIQKGSIHVYSPLYNTKAEAAYLRMLLEQYFYPENDMYNSSKLVELASTITKEQKAAIDEYFQNNSTKWQVEQKKRQYTKKEEVC